MWYYFPKSSVLLKYIILGKSYFPFTILKSVHILVFSFSSVCKIYCALDVTNITLRKSCFLVNYFLFILCMDLLHSWIYAVLCYFMKVLLPDELFIYYTSRYGIQSMVMLYIYSTVA